MKAIRFGVIGCGGMAAQVHVPNLLAIDGIQIVAYCDIDVSKATALKEAHGGEYVTSSADEIFGDNSIDAVIIQVGPALHPSLVQKAAQAGKHIFVEKPLAIAISDALDTVQAVEAAGVKFVFGTCNRLAPMVQKAKSMCPHPLYSFCQCTDSVTDQSVHNIDLAINLFHESPVRQVFGQGANHWNLDPHLPIDSFSSIISFEDGSSFTYIQHGRAYNSIMRKYHFQLFGQDSCVYLARRFKECHLMTGPDDIACSWRFDGGDTARGRFGYMGHYEELAELVSCIRDGGEGTMTVRDAARDLAVEKAILESAQSGEAVNFADFLRRHGATKLHQRV